MAGLLSPVSRQLSLNVSPNVRSAISATIQNHQGHENKQLLRLPQTTDSERATFLVQEHKRANFNKLTSSKYSTALNNQGDTSVTSSQHLVHSHRRPTANTASTALPTSGQHLLYGTADKRTTLPPRHRRPTAYIASLTNGQPSVLI